MADSKNFLQAAVVTGLLAGTLDLLGAVINYMITHERFPYRILEYIASGAFGRSAMNGSLGSNLWGLFFHYLIAVSFTLFYFIIYPGLRFLQQSVIFSAIIYGLFIWAVTNMIVLPLSAIQADVLPASLETAARAAFILIICIGLPVAFFARRFYGT